MKFNNLKMFIFLTYTLLISNTVSSETFQQQNSHRTYDVVQRLEEFSENFRTAQSLETTTNHLDISKLLEGLGSIDFNTLSSLLLNIFSKSSNIRCLQDLVYTAQKLNETTLKDLGNNSWALQMLDSFGKPEGGILSGNTKWLGDFDECRSVYAPKQKNSNVGGFHGKYCLLQVSLSIIPASIGICLPETCDSADFIHNGKNVLNSVPGFDQIKSIITVNSLSCRANTRRLSDAAIVTIFLISIFVFLAFLGSLTTIIKYYTTVKSRANPRQNIINQDEATGDSNKANFNSDEKLQFPKGSRTKLNDFIEKGDPFLNCFCVITNGSKLLNTDATEGQLLCLHGLRFLSMSWVILGHIYMSSQSVIRNPKEALNQADNFLFQAVANGWYAVDSFFILSGFLLAYLYFQETAKRKDNTGISSQRNFISSLKRWVYFYVHRYIRLTPVYMIVLAFFATVNPYLGSGPLRIDRDIDPVCQKNWWWNLLYISNFKDSAEQCMSFSWYLSNDMQFFVISPLFLITLWRWPKIGFSLLAAALCGVWVTCFVLTYHYDLIAGGFGDVNVLTDPTFLMKFGSYFDKVYTKPYARAAPYLVGMAFGYIAYKSKATNYKLKNMYLWIGWLTATTLGLVCVYGVYHQVPAVLAASFYNAFSRTCYALSVSWVIFACLSGHGGPVNQILSYKLFIPLSRLTYCAYLVHPLVVGFYMTTLRNTFVFTHPTMVTLFLGLLIVTYALSMMVSLIFESPLIRLEKFVRDKFKF